MVSLLYERRLPWSGHHVEVEAPKHPIGSMRWTFVPAVDGWERCEVLDVWGEMGTRYGDYPELYAVRRPNGEISRGHFPSALRDMVPRARPPTNDRPAGDESLPDGQ